MIEKIIKNSIKCKHCGDIIISKNTHDFVTCKCGCCSVDGGNSYIRRCFTNSADDYEELSEIEYIDDKKDHPIKKIPKTIWGWKWKNRKTTFKF